MIPNSTRIEHPSSSWLVPLNGCLIENFISEPNVSILQYMLQANTLQVIIFGSLRLCMHAGLTYLVVLIDDYNLIAYKLFL